MVLTSDQQEVLVVRASSQQDSQSDYSYNMNHYINDKSAKPV